MNKAKSKTLSIVLPCLNENENIPIMHAELVKQLTALAYHYELIFVDDGSDDNSFETLQQLANGNPCIKYISLSRNFGHNNALRAGIDNAIGDAVIALDCDLQHPVGMLPQMVAAWEQGYDVVNMQRCSPSCNNLFKTLTSKNINDAHDDAMYYVGQINAMQTYYSAKLDPVYSIRNVMSDAFTLQCEIGGNLIQCQTGGVECEPLDVIS